MSYSTVMYTIRAPVKPGDPSGGGTGQGTWRHERGEGAIMTAAPEQNFSASFHLAPSQNWPPA